MKLAILILFVAMYALMIAKPDIRTWVALCVAVVVCVLGAVPVSELVDAIDFNVLMMIGGTMIVVENGRRHLNHEISVEVTSALQTAAGRMIFAKPSTVSTKQ